MSGDAESSRRVDVSRVVLYGEKLSGAGVSVALRVDGWDEKCG